MMTENSLDLTSLDLQLGDLKKKRDELNEQIAKIERTYSCERRKRLFELFNELLLGEEPSLRDVTMLATHVGLVCDELENGYNIAEAIEGAMTQVCL